MSKAWKKPVSIPEGVIVTIKDNIIIVKGKKGELTQLLHPLIGVKVVDSCINLEILDDKSKDGKMLAGLWKKLTSNMIIGVSKGFEKKLELVGVGYKAILTAKGLDFHLGFSHVINFDLPAGVSAEVTKNIINLMGIDRQLVGNVSAKIKALKPVEPYKGNGIRYVGQVVLRKAGKAAKTSSAK